LRATVFLLAVFGVSCKTTSPVPAAPAKLEAGEVGAAVARIPSYTRLDFGGLAFLGDRLYASTNIGVFEVGPGGLEGVDRWHSPHSVTSAGWPDFTRRAAWFYDEEDLSFLRVCDGAWTRIAPPERRDKTLTRGDVLEGFHLSAGRTSIWVSGRGLVWRRDFEKEEWIPEPELPTGATPTFLAALDRGLLVVAATEGRLGGDLRDRLGLETKSDRVFLLDDNGWKELPNSAGSFRTQQTVSSLGRCYLRTSDHRILQADPERISVLPAPGRSETLAVDPEGHLWGSFPVQGIYRYEESAGWVLRYPHPHAKDERWERPHLASNGTTVAYSSCSFLETRYYKGSWVGTPALWRSEGTSWKRISW
jgi:hypothetical protein